MKRLLVALVVAVSLGLAFAAPVRAADALKASHYPYVIGIFAAGNTVQVTSGEWKGSDGTVDADLTFQWYVDDDAVTDATEQTFVIPTDAVGKVVTVEVTASADGYDPTTVTGTQMASTKTGVGTVAAAGGCPVASRANKLAKVGRDVPTQVIVVYCAKPWAVGDVLVGKGPHAYDALSVFHFVKTRWVAYDRMDVKCPNKNKALWFACNVG